MSLYKYADGEIAKLNRYFIQEFLRFQGLRVDELNVLSSAKSMYRQIGRASCRERV